MSPERRLGSDRSILSAAKDLRKQTTPTEKRLWFVLRDRRLEGMKFRRQHPFGRYVLDFYCMEHKLCIEIDGGIHHKPDQIAQDQERTEYLQAHHIRVLRFTNQDVEESPQEVLQKILDAIRR